MNAGLRRLFDEQFEQVLAELPPRLHELMNEVPLVVEDYPPPEVMRKVNVRHRGNLLGLYTGIPITAQSVNQSGVPSPVVHLYREGLLRQASRRRGQIDSAELRREIRSTILHEYGHHHGLSEQDLDALGY